MRSIAQRYPLVSYYLLTLILSGLIFALLFAAGLVEGLFFLATVTPGLAAILVTLLIGGGVGVRELLGRLAALHLFHDRYLRDLHLGIQQHPR